MKKTFIISKLGRRITICLHLTAMAAMTYPSALAQQTEAVQPFELSKQWILVYANDFTETNIPADWVVTMGTARIAEGNLYLQADIEYAEIVLLKPKLESPSVRVIFDAFISGGVAISDLSAFLNSNYSILAKNKGCEGAYLFQFGANNNTVNRLRRLGKIIPETERKDILLEPFRIYKIEIVNDFGQIKMSIDGAAIFEWQDAQPLWGAEHCHIGFYTWKSEIAIDNILVYQRSVQSKK